MDNAWTAEYWRLVLVVVAALFIGVLTGYWYIAWLFPLSVYIGWQLYQLFLLERWLSSGAKLKKAPETNGAWSSIVQQVYRNKRLERKQKKRLARTLKRFNATASALPDATIVLDKSHQIEWANQVSEEILGIDRKRDSGLRIENIIRSPDFHQWLKRANLSDDLEITSPADENKTLVFRKVKFGKGQVLLTARDVSQRVQLQQMRKTFVANASHELRTPLTVISGYLDILQDTQNLPENLHQPVENAKSQVQRMEQILEDLLYLSQLQTGDLPDKKVKPVDMATVLLQQANDLKKTLANKTHRLNLDVDKALIVRAVEADIISVALNLMKNAIRHTPAGSSIQINWKRDQSGRACLEVIDDGPGIESNHIPRLTERFYRVDPGRSRETGASG
ncbi:MAG TPA: DUF3329 domain-containing protein, partial [Crenotrichaceae bacterium]|nr:DUF3329 domain-containing protein [Crenotrichaceae bacterium]